MILALVAVLVAFRIPFLTIDLPILTTEMERILVGEKLNKGLKLYSEVLTQVGPMSAFVYKMADLLGGKESFVHLILAAIFLFAQAFYLVFMVNRRNFFNERNYIVGLVYLVICHSSFEFLKLSGSMMSNLFIMMSINAVLRQLEKREKAGEDVLEAGLYVGIATLFHLSNVVLIVWVLFCLFFYTRTNLRQGVMVVLSFLLPILLCFLFYYQKGTSEEFISIWLTNFTPHFNLSWDSFFDLILTYVFSFVLGSLGILRMFRGARYNNFQNRSHQILLLFGIGAVLKLFIANELYPSSLFALTIPLALFCTGFFIHQRKMIVYELMFFAFMGIILIPMYLSTNTQASTFSYRALEDYIIKDNQIDPTLEGKRIFITGASNQLYKNTVLATGYLNWNLAKNDFENPYNFLNAINIKQNFEKDLPDVILDNENVMPKVFSVLPELSDKYTLSGQKRYTLK
ncbi:MAG: hypothetical protein ACRCVT_10305 [Leadbetterella sp.]